MGEVGSSLALVQYNIISAVGSLLCVFSLHARALHVCFYALALIHLPHRRIPFLPSFYRSLFLPSLSAAARIPFVCVVARCRWFLSDLCNPLPHIMECRSVRSSSSSHGVLFDRQVCSFPSSLARRAVQASEDIHFGVIFACFSDSQIKFASAILGTLGS